MTRTRNITKCCGFKNKRRKVLKSKSGFSEKSSEGRASQREEKRKHECRDGDRGNVSVPLTTRKGLTIVPGYHSLHKSRKARCSVISVNPRRGGRPENIHIDLPVDLSLPHNTRAYAYIHVRAYARVAGTGSSPQ